MPSLPGDLAPPLLRGGPASVLKFGKLVAGRTRCERVSNLVQVLFNGRHKIASANLDRQSSGFLQTWDRLLCTQGIRLASALDEEGITTGVYELIVQQIVVWLKQKECASSQPGGNREVDGNRRPTPPCSLITAIQVVSVMLAQRGFVVQLRSFQQWLTDERQKGGSQLRPSSRLPVDRVPSSSRPSASPLKA